jgi:hypothetical protein
MNKLLAYEGMYIFLYTKDGTKLLCTPVSMDQGNANDYIVNIIEASGKYKQGLNKISEDEVGYVVELPVEVQQGIEMTIGLVPNIKDIQHELANKQLPSRIEFGRKRNESE